MPLSSAEKRLVSDALAQLLPEGELLWVGLEAVEERAGHAVAALDQLVPDLRGIAGAVWHVDRDILSAVPRLRASLSRAARILFVVPLKPGLWAAARALAGGPPVLRFSREQACESLLLAGLLRPCVWVETPRLLCISADLPARPDSLDAFFAQPASR